MTEITNESNLKIEFIELFKRTVTITSRSPQVMFSLFGIACFTSLLLISVFSKIGN